jgi:hypothetical protein
MSLSDAYNINITSNMRNGIFLNYNGILSRKFFFHFAEPLVPWNTVWETLFLR